MRSRKRPTTKERGGVVLDASALLAYVQDERGAERVDHALQRECFMGAVNWAEVLSKLAESGRSSNQVIDDLTTRGFLGQNFQVLPFTRLDAATTGDLRPRTRHLGLSLGDRACLALGLRLGQPVLTADREWRKLDGELELEIQTIR